MKYFLIRSLLPTLLCLLIQGAVPAQVAYLDPPNPSVDKEVTLFFNALEGNKALMGYEGEVYLHTGVITDKSIDGHDWKYVVVNWGKADEKVLMKREGPDLYSFKLSIETFYKLGKDDLAQQLAFVFRNEDGTLVGKTKDNEDILVPVNGYIPPSIENKRIPAPVRKVSRIEKSPSGWNIFTDKGMVMVRPYSSRIIGITWCPGNKEVVDSSHAVIMKPVEAEYRTQRYPSGELLKYGDVDVFVHYSPFRLSYIFQGDTLLTEEEGFYNNPGNNGVRFRLDKDEAIYGAGERAVPMNRRGYRFPLYNRPFYGYEYGATMLNYSIPLTFSSKKYAILFDNP